MNISPHPHPQLGGAVLVGYGLSPLYPNLCAGLITIAIPINNPNCIIVNPLYIVHDIFYHSILSIHIYIYIIYIMING